MYLLLRGLYFVVLFAAIAGIGLYITYTVWFGAWAIIEEFGDRGFYLWVAGSVLSIVMFLWSIKRLREE